MQMKDIILIGVAVLLLVFLVNFSIAFYGVKKVLTVKNNGYDKRIYIETMSGNLNFADYEKLSKKDFYVNSTSSNRIFGQYFENPVKTNKTVVIMHGYGANMIVSIKYVLMFLSFGFNCVAFDNVNSGRSTGKKTTMSVKEVVDLAAVVKKAREMTGDNARISLHGESLGGATCLEYLALDDNIDFLISDCAYSNFKEEFVFNLKRKFRLLPFFIEGFVSMAFKLHTGRFLKELSPIDTMKKSGGYENVPILFIHGKLDVRTPVSMMWDLYNAKKGVKKAVEFPQAVHARSILNDKKRYYKEVKDFIDSLE